VSEFIEVALAVWPWWTGPLLGLFWSACIDAGRDDEADHTAWGVAFAFVLMLSGAWILGLILWISG
jgi:hypothetical protein